MNNKQEIWTAMIISGYAERHGISVSDAAARLLADGRAGYLEDCYNVLHLLSKEDVIRELTDMGAQK